MQRLIILLTFMLTAATLSKATAQGLRFHGKESDIANRSALTIPSPEDKGIRAETLDVKFTIKVNNILSSGFVFGVRNRASETKLNLMLRSSFRTDSVWLSFTKEGERELCSAVFAKEELSSRPVTIELSIDRQNDSGSVVIGGQKFELPELGLGKTLFEPQLNFGLTRHIVETASVTLSDLSVAIDGNTHEIPLNEREGTVVHDSTGGKIGLAFNPIWQINEAYYWQKLAEFSSPTPTGCAFDPLTQQFYSYNRDSLIKFDAPARTFSRLPLKGKGDLPTLHGMNFFNPADGKIYLYEIYYNNFSGEIDPASGVWKTLARTDDHKAIHHHAHILCDDGNSVILFGGYGDRQYFNKLVKFNLNTHRFDTIPLKGDEIPPRFFASMTVTASGDTLYLYGGKGNREGKQDLGVKYYYDLYLINLKDSTSKLLWQRPAPAKDRVPARTLILDRRGEELYAMAYPEYRPHTMLHLYRISLADGSETAVGDSIPMISEEIATNVALHQSVGGDRIYCVIQEFKKEGATNTRIYSIAAPPVSEAELSMYSTKEQNWVRRAFLILGVVIVLGLAAFIMVSRHRRKRFATCLHATVSSESPVVSETPVASDSPVSDVTIKLPITSVVTDPPVEEESTEVSIEEGTEDLVESADESTIDVIPEVKTVPVKEIRRRSIILPELPDMNRISLFGPFTAIDATGVDVSHLFSPKLRQIFIYILMRTLKKGGVSASDLSAVFWPDKEPDKIKNLRNVTIAKLRKILTEFQGLEIIYENGLFTAKTEDSCYCDIKRFYCLTDNLNVNNLGVKIFEENGLEPNAGEEVLAIISQGKFLQGLESPELDGFKSTVEAYALDFVMEIIKGASAERRWEDVVRCSRWALQIDPLSDVALEEGVRAYMAMDNKGRARSLYDNYVVSYRKVYGEDYPRTFADLT